MVGIQRFLIYQVLILYRHFWEFCIDKNQNNSRLSWTIKPVHFLLSSFLRSSIPISFATFCLISVVYHPNSSIDVFLFFFSSSLCPSVWKGSRPLSSLGKDIEVVSIFREGTGRTENSLHLAVSSSVGVKCHCTYYETKTKQSNPCPTQKLEGTFGREEWRNLDWPKHEVTGVLLWLVAVLEKNWFFFFKVKKLFRK